MTKRIKTYLKFQRSECDKMTFVSYVRKDSKGSWKGCRESDGCKKKVVLADVAVSAILMENVLYDTVLIPMRERMGFIAINAKPVKFMAVIDTVIDDTRYAVDVKFGYKTITYEPASSLENRRSIDGIVQTILHRIDIKEPERVARDFKEAAETVRAYYRADHPECE